MLNGVELLSVSQDAPFGSGEVVLQIPEKSFKHLFYLAVSESDPESRQKRAIYYLNSVLGGVSSQVVNPKKVIFNDKATIVFWNDDTKTVVKCQDGDTFSEEAGIALCFMKKMLGNKGNYNKVLREALDKAQRQGK